MGSMVWAGRRSMSGVGIGINAEKWGEEILKQ